MAVDCRQPMAYRDEVHKIGAWLSAENKYSFGFGSLLLLPKKGKSTISFTTTHDRTAISSRIDFSRGFRNDGSLFISHRNRGKAFMRHWVVPCRWTTGHHTDETGRRLYPIFDDNACIIVQLENAQSAPRIRPPRRTVTGWSAD